MAPALRCRCRCRWAPARHCAAQRNRREGGGDSRSSRARANVQRPCRSPLSWVAPRCRPAAARFRAEGADPPGARDAVHLRRVAEVRRALAPMVSNLPGAAPKSDLSVAVELKHARGCFGSTAASRSDWPCRP